MATLNQRLHRKNGDSYDTIHLESNAKLIYLTPTSSTTVYGRLSSIKKSVDTHTTDIATINTNIDTINTEISDLKTSVSNGKSAVASAITDKGVSTSATASFSTMATNIGKIKVNSIPVVGTDFTYTGDYYIEYDSTNDYWKIKFLTSGTFKPLKAMTVDVFLVGGGAGGSAGGIANEAPGGGGGYTTTTKKVSLTKNTSYSIVIGDGGARASNGGDTSAFSSSAGGGKKGTGSSSSATGGDGGSGGAGSGSNDGELGGTDGANGGGSTGRQGKGQGTTTREFGESTGRLYSTGGASGNYINNNSSYIDTGSKNTGDGGSGSRSQYPGKGGSGIVVIRTAR